MKKLIFDYEFTVIYKHWLILGPKKYMYCTSSNYWDSYKSKKDKEMDKSEILVLEYK